MTTQTKQPKHPARFTDVILERIETLLPYKGVLLDPFAGTGKVHQLATDTLITWGVEIEPEWATIHPRTIVGSALYLPFQDHSIDVVVTSPTYGNRFADSHRAMDGSTRRSYTHDLGRTLHDDNSGAMQWGDRYRRFHLLAWMEAVRVLKPGGAFILNCKDHVRNKQVIAVTEWHLSTLQDLTMTLDQLYPVPVRGLRFGQNAEARVTEEWVAVLYKAD